MSTLAINLIIVALALSFIWRTMYRIRRDDIGFRAGVLWLGIWVLVAIVSLFPDILNALQETLNFQYRLNMALVAAILLLLVMAANTASRLERMKRDEARAIQEVAILNHRIDRLIGELRKRDVTIEGPRSDDAGPDASA